MAIDQRQASSLANEVVDIQTCLILHFSGSKLTSDGHLEYSDAKCGQPMDLTFISNGMVFR